METNKDILDQPTTYSGTTSSRSITKGDTMTKKHFELVAKIISNRANAIENSSADNNQKAYTLFELINLMFNFADEFELVNKNFNKSIFFNACQPVMTFNNHYRELGYKEKV